MSKNVLYFAIVRGIKEPYKAIVTTRDELVDMKVAAEEFRGAPVLEFPITKEGAKLFCDIARARGLANQADYLVAKYL